MFTNKKPVAANVWKCVLITSTHVRAVQDVNKHKEGDSKKMAKQVEIGKNKYIHYNWLAKWGHCVPKARKTRQ